MQLAQKYREPKSFPVAVEPKIDGVRCWFIVFSTGKHGKVKALSRNGTYWTDKLEALCDSLRDAVGHAGLPTPCVIDGELHCGSFGRTISAINRKACDACDDVCFHVFDVLEGEHCECGDARPYEARRKSIMRLFGYGMIKIKNVQPIKSELCNDALHIKSVYEKYLDEGYEGAMIKTLDGDYITTRRTCKWMKLKPFIDVSGIVIGINERGCPIVKLDSDDGGKVITLSSGYTESERKHLIPGVRVDMYVQIADREQPYSLKRAFVYA